MEILSQQMEMMHFSMEPTASSTAPSHSETQFPHYPGEDNSQIV